MRKVIIMFALAMGIVTANAQENVTVGTDNGSEPTNEARAEASSLDYALQGGGRQSQQPTLTKEVYPQKEADGDLYHGLSRKLTFDRMIPPHGLEVTYDKTVHVIFPAEVRYVDLGSPDLIAGKADGAENVIRVKATVRNFSPTKRICPSSRKTAVSTPFNVNVRRRNRCCSTWRCATSSMTAAR